MAPYESLFGVGERVRLKPRDALEAFRRSWKLHHPLSEDQLAFAGRTTTVKAVGFYHGGDVLYTLEDVPGTWHQSCVGPPD